ncbi:hypothetical protein BGW38_008775 [Lunasporangiospora selenospora]|uniref:Protein kinase domain-containing protein n=1 Tax=Lunasporangiospora selenospora TaxID=979761 RepID=A0A9P6FXT8_9FUNG|nr:hypothetical protein BGW38_008775 [Lunasporangiospora selenospora]
MVERRDTGKVYALKYIAKAQVIKMEAVRNILRERHILENLDHVFVVNLRFAFQDDEYMYMCMDLMMGGDLRFHMNRKTFNESTVRFWIAELSSAVNHLHSLGIVHRDIKPDNVLLDSDGHAHLTDFNIGCNLTEEKPILMSQSGTVAYMAPEVFKGTGYGTSVDWWAIGVLFYECIYNQRPFQTETIAELKRAIQHQKIEYPAKEGVSRECIEAMNGFLTRDPRERLGAQSGMYGIRYHPFFEEAAYQHNMSVDQWWQLLETKRLTPEYRPPSENANFDATFDMEELLLDDDPLTYSSTRKRAQRIQREKDRAIKEESARQKAEDEEAHAVQVAAAKAMEEMNKNIEESLRRLSIKAAAKAAAGSSTSSSLNKKDSRSNLGGNSDGYPPTQPTIQTKAHTFSEPGTRQVPGLHQTLSSCDSQSSSQYQQSVASVLSRQTQFQSIPLSPIDTPPNGSREFPTPTSPTAVVVVPQLRFPSSPPPDRDFVRQTDYNPPMAPSWPRPLSPELHPASFYLRPKLTANSSGLPIAVSTATMTVGPKNKEPMLRKSASGEGFGITSVSLSNPADFGEMERQQLLKKASSLSLKRNHDYQVIMGGSIAGSTNGAGVEVAANESMADHMLSSSLVGHDLPMLSPQPQSTKYIPFQPDGDAALPQQAISSPVIIPVPLDHSISRQRRIPTQQPVAQSLRRPTTPTTGGIRSTATGGGTLGAVNIAGAAAAASEAAILANMSEKEREVFLMELIDREFTTFDYTVYESYNGLVDPVTMSVGDPPEWVRSRDK